MAEVATRAAEVIQVDASGASAPAVGSTELPSLRSEGERLKLERDNAQLRAELATLTRPWWRKGAIVTTLTAIIAAVVPVTTAVQAHYEKERELALQESKQGHEIRTSYLDRLEKPGAKLRTLRFVLATTTDPVLKDWARDEAKVVQAELDDIDRQIAALETPVPTVVPFGGSWMGWGCGKETADERRMKEEQLRARETRIRTLKEQRITFELPVL